MLSEQYINEGIRIRKKYLENIREILKQEPIIFEKKKEFQKLQNEMSEIVKSELNDLRKTLELNNKLILLEKEIKYIQDIIRPYYDTIENLKNDRDRLYISIIEKYPNITTEQIEHDIMTKIEE